MQALTIVRAMVALLAAAVAASATTATAAANLNEEPASLGTLLRCDGGSARCLWADGRGNEVDAAHVVREMMAVERLDAREDEREYRRLQEHMQYLEAVRTHAVREGLEFSYKVGVNARHLYIDDARPQSAHEFVRQELHAQTRRRLEAAEQQQQSVAVDNDSTASHRRLTTTVPSTLNWCSTDNPMGKSICTTVKRQNKCGSCWAFAATDAIETAVAVASKKDPQALSPQQFLDCSTRNMTATFKYCWAASGVTGAKWLLTEMKWGSQNNGCDGGMTHGAFQDAAGLRLNLMSELDLPYKEVDQVTLNPFKTQTVAPANSKNATCESDPAKAAASIANWEQAVGKSCDASSDPTQLLKIALQTQPISVAINSGSNFKDYKGGLYECPNNGDFTDSSQIDHAVVLVGYGREGSTDYWILKNSYSSQWGDKGYLKLKMDTKINCGINIFPVVPTGAKAGVAKTAIEGGGDKVFLYLSPTLWIMIASVVSIGTIVLTVFGVLVSRRLRAEQLSSGRQ